MSGKNNDPAKNIANLRVCDLPKIEFIGDYYTLGNYSFGKVICQGRLIHKHRSTAKNSSETRYRFLLEDETGSITAFFTTKSNNTLEEIMGSHKKFTDIGTRFGYIVNNKKMKFNSTEEEEEFNTRLLQLQQMIVSNVKSQPVQFESKDFDTKYIILGRPFKNVADEVFFRIHEINKLGQFEELGKVAISDFYSKNIQTSTSN